MTAFSWTEAIETIHSSGYRCVIAATGGGSSAISRLLEVPGGSQSVLEAIVPYSLASLEDWIGGTAEQACSEATARDMAVSAWMRARDLAEEADPLKLVGVGVTASLASSRPKRGDHRVHIAVQTASLTVTKSLTMEKGLRNRTEEEKLVSDLVLVELAKVCGVATSEMRVEPRELLSADEHIVSRHKQAPAVWTDLLLGRENIAWELPADESESGNPVAMLPGSFNPPHQGHIEMASYAAERLGGRVCFELSITNVDKPPLDFLEVAERIAAIRQLAPNSLVLLTNAPTFRRKSNLMPGTTFLVGADTMSRIADPKYYTQQNPEDARGLEIAIASIAARNCQFLVFGREIDGNFCLLEDLDMPESLLAISTQVSANEFRHNISSTELRRESSGSDGA